MSNNIAIFGAGGFGREVACVVNELKKNGATWNFIGFLMMALKLELNWAMERYWVELTN